jgi:hypothetical protein
MTSFGETDSAARLFADRRAWLRLLARWGVFTALMVAGLMSMFFATMADVSTQPGFGGDHDELLMAAFASGGYRLAMIFDALGWLAMGGLIVIAGIALSRDASLRGPLGATLGVTAIAGVIGAFTRLAVVGDLGRQLAAASSTDQIAGVLLLNRTVTQIVGAHFGTGQLTIGLGFLVLGSAALGVAWFPRGIAWLLVAPGITSIVLLIGELFDVFLFPVLLVHVSLLAVLGLAMARSWWRVPLPAGEAVAVDPAGT